MRDDQEPKMGQVIERMNFLTETTNKKLESKVGFEKVKNMSGNLEGHMHMFKHGTRF